MRNYILSTGKLIALVAAFAWISPASSQESGEPISRIHDAIRASATELHAGLMVQAGVSAPTDALKVASTGRWLVHVIHTDIQATESARSLFNQQNLTGLISAESYASLRSLPYRDNAVTLLVVDADALGKAAPSDEEVLRVLTPKHGAALVKRGGTWTQRSKAWPKDYGNWTHLYGKPSGNAFADDSVVDVPTGIAWVGETGAEQNVSTLVNDGVIIMGDKPTPQMVLGELPRRKDVQQRWGKGIKTRYSKHAPYGDRLYLARNAFNGVPLYRQSLGWGYHRLIMGDKFISVKFTGNKPAAGREYVMVAYDLHTGKELRTFTEGLTGAGKGGMQKFEPKDEKGRTRKVLFAAGVGNILVQSSGNEVVALDVNTGERLWSYTSPQNHTYAIALTEDGKDVYFGEGEWVMGRARFYGARKAKHIVRLDAKTGKLIWRANIPVIEGAKRRAGSHSKFHPFDPNDPGRYQQLSQLIPIVEEDKVFINGGDHHGWNGEVAYVAALNMKDGSLAWLRGANRGGRADKAPRINRRTFTSEDYKAYFAENQEAIVADSFNDHSDASNNNMFYRNGKLEYYGSYCIWLYDADTGFMSRMGQGNMGCQRSVGTPHMSYIASYSFARTVEHGHIEYDEVGLQHPHCADGFVPSQGMWFTESTRFCGCIPHIWSQFSMVSHETPELIPVSQRLEKPGQFPGKDATPLGRVVPTQEHTFSPILASWERGYYGPVNSKDANFHEDAEGWVSPSLKVKDWEFKIDAQAHRLVAFQGDKALWSYQAGGRITGQPVIHGGNIYFGSRDGYVYALRASTGDPQWRFLAARNHHKMYFSGQLESVWPATNVVLYEGNLFVAAGIHNMADGGIQTWGLNPRDGSVAWNVEVFMEPIRGLKNGQHNFDHGSRSEFQNTMGGVRTVHAVGIVKDKPSLLYWNRGSSHSATPIDVAQYNGKRMDKLTGKIRGGSVVHMYPWLTEEDLFRRRAKNKKAVVNFSDEDIQRAKQLGMKLEPIRAGQKSPKEYKQKVAEYNERLKRLTAE